MLIRHRTSKLTLVDSQNVIESQEHKVCNTWKVRMILYHSIE